MARKFIRYNHETGETEEFEKPVVNVGVAHWPIESYSAGGHPKQRRDLEAYLRAEGVPTEVNERGNPIMTGPRHRKRVVAALSKLRDDGELRVGDDYVS